MRLAGLSSVLLVVVFTLGVVCAHAVGQARHRDVFPLPDAAGCWQGLCFDDLPVSQIPIALNAHPRVQPGTARFVENRVPIGDTFPLVFQDAPSHDVIRLYISPGYYVMNRTDGALMALGDLIAHVGPPTGVVRVDNAGGYLLYYQARNLAATVRVAESGYWWFRVQPDDPVRFVEMQADSMVYLPGFSAIPAWRGFTTYTLTDDE